jgi:hypothetical protein
MSPLKLKLQFYKVLKSTFLNYIFFKSLFYLLKEKEKIVVFKYHILKTKPKMNLGESPIGFYYNKKGPIGFHGSPILTSLSFVSVIKQAYGDPTGE